MVILLIFLMSVSKYSWASDHGQQEGQFINQTNHNLSCFGDTVHDQQVICHRVIIPTQRCFADAIGIAEGQTVFKIPNRVEFFCSRDVEGTLSCKPKTWKDQLIYFLARKKNGEDKYGLMTWEHFHLIMGVDRQLRNCDVNGLPLSK